MKKTFKEIGEFDRVSGEYMKAHPESIKTKFGYALHKMGEGPIMRIVRESQNAYRERYHTDVIKVQLDNALKDKATGAVILAPKGSQRPYLFDADGLDKVITAENRFTNKTQYDIVEEWDAKEFEFEPYYVKPEDVPELTEDEAVVFSGFVVEPVVLSEVK